MELKGLRALLLLLLLPGGGAGVCLLETMALANPPEVAPQVPLPLKFLPKEQGRALVKTDDHHLYLGDIAKCEGYRPLCDYADGIDLGSGPLPGARRIIGHQELRPLLEEALTGAVADLQFSDPLVIEANHRVVPPREIRSALDKFLARMMPEEGPEQYFVKRLMTTGQVKVRPRETEFSFPELNPDDLDKRMADGRWEGAMRVVAQSAQNQEGTPFSVKIRLAVRRLVATAAVSLKRGQSLSATDVELRWREIRKYDPAWFVHPRQLQGLVLRQNLRPGAPIHPRYVQRKNVVNRGQIVEVSIVRGAVRVSGRGKAAKSGAVGDEIQITMHKSRKKIRARVTGLARVEVKL